jgi:dienelactone hydrolase
MAFQDPLKEEIVQFQSQDHTLIGLLSLPKEMEEAIPGVIFLHGFTSDRDESPIAGTDEAMFERAAKDFNAAGTATLRFDFYGHGESGGRFEKLTLDALIADALAAVAHLSSRPEVASDRIGLLGQSMGGLVAACAAHRDSRIRAIALWNPPSHPLYTWAMAMGSGSVHTALTEGSVEFVWDDKGPFKLNRTFFDSLSRTSPLVEISKFKGSLLTIVGREDEYIYPQPHMGEAFVHAHSGRHELHTLDADHTFNISSRGTELLDHAIQTTIAWFRREL